jgi:glyoxylase-like metal-dependent hydrolase (beta-lactamase superfamily II)
MTSALHLFLAGLEGDITYPVQIYVIEHPSGLVLIDAGLHPELARKTNRLKSMAGMFQVHLAEDGSESVSNVLVAAGFDPALISHVILTHMHFDHGGGLAEIPNATVLVQKKEWQMLSDEEQVARGTYNPDDVDLGHHRVELEGDHDVFGDGLVTCLMTDGHTPGHQSVRIQTESGAYIVCGDCCYVRKTVEDEHLPPFAFDAERQLASVRRLADEQRSGATLLFGHDPEQWKTIENEGLHEGV